MPSLLKTRLEKKDVFMSMWVHYYKKNFDLVHLVHDFYGMCLYYEKRYRFNKKNVVLMT